jgi:hypothetical protein
VPLEDTFIIRASHVSIMESIIAVRIKGVLLITNKLFKIQHV